MPIYYTTFIELRWRLRVVPSKTGPKWWFMGQKGVKSLIFGFATPKRHVLARNRVFWRILRQNPCGRLGCRWDEEPKKRKRKNSRVNNLMREIAHAQKRNPLSDQDEILHDGRYPRRNYVGNVWWRSVKGFMGGRGSNFGISHWLWLSSLQHSRTTVRVCDENGWTDWDGCHLDWWLGLALGTMCRPGRCPEILKIVLKCPQIQFMSWFTYTCPAFLSKHP